MNFDLQLFAEEDLQKQSSKSIKKGIRSLKKVIAIHQAKILNPESFYPNEWNNLKEEEKKGNFKHWQKEIENAKKSINNRIEELRKRGEEIDE
ncbi:MAG: hypothetical protein IJ728_09140 [Selenomonadaceae bacterium]|nr:hypothetical protein [Selenomonadaceae bacterium]